MYVYIQSEPGLFTVGFYSPGGKWHSDTDHTTRESAATRVNFLNGGNPPPPKQIDDLNKSSWDLAEDSLSPDYW